MTEPPIDQAQGDWKRAAPDGYPVKLGEQTRGGYSQRDQPPPPGQGPIVLAALSIGILMMGVQLWLLTVALDLYLAGKGREIWLLALVSGIILVGGLLMTQFLRRRPRVRRPLD